MRSQDGYDKLKTARRFFSLIPIATFLIMLILLASASSSAEEFGHAVLRSFLVALVSALVCVAAYGFYRYLQERSPGL